MTKIYQDISFSPENWVSILEDVYRVSISDKLDSIDIAWDGLSEVLPTLEGRYLLVLKRLYADGLTLKECGNKMPRKDKLKGPIGTERIRQMKHKAIRMLRHPSRKKIIDSCIVGAWRLNHKQ